MASGFIDSHLHMTDIGFGDGYADIVDANMLFSCTAEYSEWNRLMDIAGKDAGIIPFYGIHPWYVGDSNDVIESLEPILESDVRACVGEIGLDAMHLNMKEQMSLFINQLQLANKYDRPVAIHMVRTEKDVLDAIRSVHVGRSILHSFSGPINYIRSFSDAGCYFSISPRILSKSQDKIRSILESIPFDRLLIETDAPNCYRYCSTMSEHISRLSEIMSVDPQNLVDITSENAKRIIE